MNCARSARGGISAAGGETLSTIFYEYPLRNASCEHTVLTGRLDARTVMQRVRHYGNESIRFWNGTEYYGNPQAVQHAADLKTSLSLPLLEGAIPGGSTHHSCFLSCRIMTSRVTRAC